MTNYEIKTQIGLCVDFVKGAIVLHQRSCAQNKDVSAQAHDIADSMQRAKFCLEQAQELIAKREKETELTSS